MTPAQRQARLHRLKTWPLFFDAVDSGEKTFEVRRNDRQFAVGDILELEEYDPRAKAQTGRSCKRRITYIVSLDGVGMDGFVGMSIDVL